MRVVVTRQFSPSLRISQGPVFPDAHFETPYPGSPVGGPYGQRNKKHPFDSKGLRKFHPIIVNPITISIHQADTFPRLHSSNYRQQAFWVGGR